jgi:hypothetical protein
LGEYFVKQTLRNRYEICTANGKQRLTIPIAGSKNHRSMDEITISYKENWPLIHWRTIESAYRNSPFFEYYENDFRLLLASKEERLAEFNKRSLSFLEKAFKAKCYYSETKVYVKEYPDSSDLRQPINWKSINKKEKPYLQPFSERNGFIPNLSALDYLFCVGPNGLKEY